MQTIQVRSRAKLRELEKDIKIAVRGPCVQREYPATLNVPILTPCSLSEMLTISVDIQTGALKASVAQYGKYVEFCDDLFFSEDCL